MCALLLATAVIQLYRAELNTLLSPSVLIVFEIQLLIGCVLLSEECLSVWLTGVRPVRSNCLAIFITEPFFFLLWNFSISCCGHLLR